MIVSMTSMTTQMNGDLDVSVAFTNKVVEQLEKDVKKAETDLLDWIGSQGLQALQPFLKLMSKEIERSVVMRRHGQEWAGST